jgi:hypothetical protein
MTPSIIPRCRGNFFAKPLSSNDRGIHRSTDTPLIRHAAHRKRRGQQFFCCFLCIFVAKVMFPPSRCLATFTCKHRLSGGIYEVRRSDGLMCHDTRTKYHGYPLRRNCRRSHYYICKPLFNQTIQFPSSPPRIELHASTSHLETKIPPLTSLVLRWTKLLQGSRIYEKRNVVH